MLIDLGAHLLYGILSGSSQFKMSNFSILGHFGGLLQIFWKKPQNAYIGHFGLATATQCTML